MSDLVERLRKWQKMLTEIGIDNESYPASALLHDAGKAADEIERLTTERDHYREQYMQYYYHEAAAHIAENERLRAALEHCADGIAVEREQEFWSADQSRVWLNGLENTAREALQDKDHDTDLSTKGVK